jgi:hypothetical protein
VRDDRDIEMMGELLVTYICSFSRFNAEHNLFIE